MPIRVAKVQQNSEKRYIFSKIIASNPLFSCFSLLKRCNGSTTRHPTIPQRWVLPIIATRQFPNKETRVLLLRNCSFLIGKLGYQSGDKKTPVVTVFPTPT